MHTMSILSVKLGVELGPYNIDDVRRVGILCELRAPWWWRWHSVGPETTNARSPRHNMIGVAR